MPDKIEDLLGSLPPAEWQLDQLIILDWHDGPVEGVCMLRVPEVAFHFKQMAERRSGEGTIERLYRLSEISMLTFERIREALETIEPARKPIWAPAWINVPAEVERILDDAFQSGRRTQLAVLSRDMEKFEGLFDLEQANRKLETPPDGRVSWFERLGIA